MHQPIRGLHHVTAIASDPQANIDFYTGPLGLRLVKQTVNFDDPGTWHLYYGDALGSPGSVLTFFPFPGARPGRVGAGQVVETALAIPQASVGFWIDRLQAAGIDVALPEPRRDGETALRLRDPDGLRLALVGQAQPEAEERQPWPEVGLPERHAIRGFFGLRLAVASPPASRRLLGDGLGLTEQVGPADSARFLAADGGAGAALDLLDGASLARGVGGAGTVHHLALRVADGADQLAWRQRIAATIPTVTPVADRHYFRSIYFREPGGILFELATDGPGFAVDEPVAQLGAALRLPAWLEPQRPRIVEALPPIRPPRPSPEARDLLERLAAGPARDAADPDLRKPEADR
ncbi:MAG: ring-cleaving dioxygenase [Caldilineae bacterium]|nr:ring-cleaving dioxygenase [Caldilineae bacterium]